MVAMMTTRKRAEIEERHRDSFMAYLVAFERELAAGMTAIRFDSELMRWRRRAALVRKAEALAARARENARRQGAHRRAWRLQWQAQALYDQALRLLLSTGGERNG